MTSFTSLILLHVVALFAAIAFYDESIVVAWMMLTPPTCRGRCLRSMASQLFLSKGFGGGDGFSQPKSTLGKKVDKKTMLKRVEKKYGGATAQDIARGTQRHIDQSMAALPQPLQLATQLYQRLRLWEAHLSTLSVLQQANLSPQESEGARRAQEELDRILAENLLTENDLHNIFQQITWDASADAKAARSLSGEMTLDISSRIDQACQLVAEAVLAAGPAGRCLDVGCGYGVLVPSLIKSGLSRSQIVGVDLSREMIKNAQQLHPGVKFCGSDFLTFADSSSNEAASPGYNAVIFCSSLHDMPDIPAVLRHAASLLRPGGRLVLVHPQGASHVEKQVQSNPVLVKRGLPGADELGRLEGLTLVKAPAAPNTMKEAEEGYLAVLERPS